MTFEKGFNQVLFDCIDRAASSILGKDGMYTFYYAIQEKHNLPIESFPQKPIVVLDFLNEVLGDAGYSIIKHAVVSEIKKTFAITADIRNFDTLAQEAKTRYLTMSF